MIKKLTDNKIIVCSDLHIHNYTDYAPTEKQLETIPDINPLGFKNTAEYRLNQIMMIAKRIIYECRQNNTKTVFILGDLIHSPNCSPVVLNTLKLFIKLLTDDKITVYYILGQHDLKVRRTDCDLRKDSYVGTLRNSHFIYAHGKQFDINGHIVEFKNFDFDNSIIETKKDTEIFLTHQSINMGQSSKGKSLKMVIAGDIHDKVDFTSKNVEYHSCMTPFVIYPHQSMNGYIGLLDCSNKIATYKRIPSNGKILSDNNKTIEFKLFDILESEDYKQSILNEKIKTIRDSEISIDETDTDALSGKFDIRDVVHIDETVKEIAKENDFEDLYSELTLTDLPKPLDFDFELLTLDIENVRSIDKMHLDFKNLKGITYLNGKNGSGKSSIIKSIEVALLGDNRIKSLLRKGCSNLTLDICLKYKKSLYRIVRKVGKTDFYKDNEKFDLSKRDTEQKILEELPFLEYLNYFICHANSHFFDNVDRTQLIMDIFNLNPLNFYREAIEDLQDEVKDIIKENELDKVTEESRYNTLESEANNIKTKIENIKNDNVIIIDNANEKLDEFNKLTHDIQKSLEKCNAYKNSIESTTKIIEQNTDEIRYNKAIKCLDEIKTYDDINSKIEEQEHKIKTDKHSLDSLIALRDNLINSPKCICPECNHEFYLDNVEDKIKECDIDISRYSATISKMETEVDFLKEGLQNLTTDFSKSECQSIIQKYQTAKQLMLQLDEIKSNYETEKKNGSEMYNKKKQLLSDNSCTKDDEYCKLLKDSIDYTLRKQMFESDLIEINEKLSKSSQKLSKINENIEKLTKKYNKCEKFAQLFDMDNLNSIPYKIIDKVIHSLDSKSIRFTSTKELANGEDRFDINVEIKVADNWIAFDQSSDGQKIILDSFLLFTILSNIKRVGILILDEFLANCDSDKIDFASSVIGKMGKFVNNIFVTSHSEFFNKYDNRLDLELIDGKTAIS